jgi:hypothetical protein
MLLRRLPLVMCIRNPLKVARSLGVRNGFNESKGLALWFAYMTSVTASASMRPTLVIDYERTLADPMGTTDTLRRFLADTVGLPDGADSSAAAQAAIAGYNRSGGEASALSELATSALSAWRALAELHGERWSPDSEALVTPTSATQILEILSEGRRVQSRSTAELDVAVQRHDETLRHYSEAIRQRDEVIRQRDEVIRQRDEVIRQRDEAIQRGDDVRHRFNEAVRQLDHAQGERDAAVERARAVEDSRLGRWVGSYRRLRGR